MIGKLIEPVTGLLDKFIEDKDQKAQLAHMNLRRWPTVMLKRTGARTDRGEQGRGGKSGSLV
jgi:hypothetical protein